MIKHTTRFLLIIGLIIGFGVSITAQEGEPPYIYYYSNILNAFVIERADGTDSRLLAQNVIPNIHDSVHSVQWSPSGEWMVWLSGAVTLGGSSASKVWIMSSDGQTRISLLDDVYDVKCIKWSPTQDLLMVVYHTPDPYPETKGIVSIIDVPNNRVIAQVTLHGSYESSAGIYFASGYGWADDGSAIYFMYGNRMTITRMEMNNQIESWTFDDFNPLIDAGNWRLVYWRTKRQDQQFYYEMVIEDLSTREQMILRTFENWSDSKEVDYDLYWNSEGDYALAQERHCEEYRCDPVGMSIFNWDTGELHELPSNLRLPSPPSHLYHDDFWSPDEHMVILYDDEEQPYLVEIESGEVHSLNVDEISNWHWIANDGLMLFREPDVLYHYDLHTHTLTQETNFEELGRFYFDLAPSPDGTYIGIKHHPVRIMNSQTGERQTWPRHSNTMRSFSAAGYNWNEDSEWFFSGGSNFIAGGGGSNINIMIHHIDDSSRRELTLCNDVQTCVGFVPDRALSHLAEGQPTSHTPVPTLALVHESSVSSVAWNTGGDRLASYTFNYDDGGFIYIWDMSSEVPVIVEQFPTGSDQRSILYMSWVDDITIELNGDGVVKKLNIQTGEFIQSEVDDNSRDTSFDGRYTVTTSDDPKQWSIIDNATGNTLTTVSFIEQDIRHIPNSQMDYHPGVGLVASSGVYHQIDLWNVHTGELMPFNWTALSVDFSPDGMLLAAAGTQYVTIWDMTPYIQISP